VDPEMQRLRKAQLTQANGQRHMPQRVVGRREGRIGPDHGDTCSYQQNNAAGGLNVHKTLDGGESALGKKLDSRQVLYRRRAGHNGISRVGGPTHAKPVLSRNITATHLGIEYSQMTYRRPAMLDLSIKRQKVCSALP